jgi:hypothetical protein
VTGIVKTSPFDIWPAIHYSVPQHSPWTNVLSRKLQTLKSAVKAVSDAALQLKEVGLDDLAADLRASVSKLRREINHVESVKDHPDLFS